MERCGGSTKGEPTGPGGGAWGRGSGGRLRDPEEAAGKWRGESGQEEECCNSSHFISVHCGQIEQKLQTKEGRNRA